jgi:hypothetical protein
VICLLLVRIRPHSVRYMRLKLKDRIQVNDRADVAGAIGTGLVKLSGLVDITDYCANNSNASRLSSPTTDFLLNTRIVCA